jgi:cobalt/nickel transport system permease protein
MYEHNTLDDYAYSNALRNISPRLKLALGLGAMLLCIASASPIAPLFIAVTISLITVGVAKIPWRVYSKLLLIPLSFALLSAIVVAFVTGGGETLLSFTVLGWTLNITEGGANEAFLVIARTFGGMCSLFFIALTTPMIEIFSVFKSLGVPDFLVDLSMLMYRYIFVFIDQAAVIHNAQVMRLGDAGLKSTLNSHTLLSSVLFIRAWEQGERLIVAMDARCYDGKLSLIKHASKAEPRAICVVIGYMVVVAAIAFLTKDIQLL